MWPQKDSPLVAPNVLEHGNPAEVSYTVAPGSRFLYNNWDFNALGTIYEQATGRSFCTAFTEDIAAPAGLQDWSPHLQQIRDDTGKSRYPADHSVLPRATWHDLGR